MFSQAQLDSARKRAQEVAGNRGEARQIAGDGSLVRQIPREAYLNALSHGVDPADDGYWRDMDRLYPENVVKQQFRTFSMISRAAGGKRRNLFGVVSWSKRYA